LLNVAELICKRSIDGKHSLGGVKAADRHATTRCSLKGLIASGLLALGSIAVASAKEHAQPTGTQQLAIIYGIFQDRMVSSGIVECTTVA